MTAQLHIRLQAEASPRTMALEGTCAIGRDASNDLVIDDPLVSRNHALVSLLSGKQYYVTDLGSSNGTFLNGRPITVPSIVKSGDEIKIGSARLILDFPQETEGLLPPPTNIPINTVMDFASQTIAILVVDIRGFTHLSETIPTADLARFIGSWFRDLSQAIERRGGTIDKFIGDAVMAYWVKAPDATTPSFVIAPLLVAQELLQLAETFHTKLVQEYPTEQFRIGCGIHTGQASFGNVGNVAGRDFTAMGDCVNVTFRIEALCREKARAILVSHAVKELAGSAFQFEDCGACQLKGRAEQVHVFSLR